MGVQEQYRSRKEKGLCVVCGRQPAAPDRVRCQPCHEKYLAWQQANRKSKRNDTVCACGKPPRAGATTCEGCYLYHRNYNRKRANRTRSDGLCVRCGDRPELGKKSCAKCLEAGRRNYRKLRDEVFAAYGGYACACCGESTPEFLQIDHIDGSGGLRRRMAGSNYLYKWLRARGYPEGFQVLCANCNIAKSRYGVCPHQTRR
jgi:hypothetical protein